MIKAMMQIWMATEINSKKNLEILNKFTFLISLILRYPGLKYRQSSAKVCLRDLACIFGYLIAG